ncbi:von Willebrand factor, type A [Penicillium italicum]|uniref:von Willebrand factor, type A n=1 Tax=Penicillium italicum TaxID=40296 RepID=A0A0A2KH94_PENIT|nr:von Willebrand factor, type A [Penicillium italicum]
MTSYCGCIWNEPGTWKPQYLPQVSLKAHATILSSAARTTLTQTFVNPSNRVIEEISYHFPLYDGVSVVGFECKVGSRLLHSKVKTKSQANTDYQNAVAQHRTAAVMDHTSMNDVLVIRLGNVPARGKITVDITFVGELKQDSQTGGIRYTLPSTIAPRYGASYSFSQTQLSSFGLPAKLQGMSVTVDVKMGEGLVIRELESPSHRVKVSLGRVSSTPATSATFEPSQASASVIHQQNNPSVVLEQDFVVLIKADGLDKPCALLERHPTIPNQRALMATLVPKFSLRPASPEVVFVIDRSGSMAHKIPTLRSALQVFLKSLPVDACFNICSFGTSHSFMWETSQVYDAFSLQQALEFVGTIEANMGGTEMEQAVVATVHNRLHFKDLDVLILTDGQIYDQEKLFDFVRERAADNTARFFSLGIGEAASHSLIEGIARAGNGFCQSVTEYEELDRKVVRMLKGALTPHVNDYKLEVEYDTETEQEFDFVSETEDITESETEAEEKEGDGDIPMEEMPRSSSQPIPLYDENFKEPDAEVDAKDRASEKLPTLAPPRAIQAPYNIPPLYPFIRTNVFLLMDPYSVEKAPKSLRLSATSNQGPLELRIPICDIGTGETIHQLASRKAVIELEEGHGWLSQAKDENGNKFKQFHTETKRQLTELECQNLGIKFQMTGKYCSFVALEESSSSSSEQRGQEHTPKHHAVEYVSPIAESARFSNFPAHASPPYVIPARTGGVHVRGLRGGGVRGSQGALRQMQAVSMSSGTLHASHSTQAPSPPMVLEDSSSLYFAAELPEAPRFCDVRQAQTATRPFYQMAAVLVPPTPTLTRTPQMRMHELIQLQTYEGSWMWSTELFELLGCDVNATINQLATLYNSAGRKIENEFPHGDEATVLATLLAMGSLRKKHSASRAVWELVHAKASEWVRLELKNMQSQGSPAAIIASIQKEIFDMV